MYIICGVAGSLDVKNPDIASLIRATLAGAFARIDLFAVIHETADALVGGADRECALAAMRWILRRALEQEAR